MSDDDFAFGFKNKFMGQVNLVRFGSESLADGGSITLTGGIGGRHQVDTGFTSIAAMNLALEGFVEAAK
jgi:hypothetical protein